MSNKTSTESLYNEFHKLIEAGDETAARSFLTSHLKDFPEDLRNKLIFAFFEESLEKQSSDITAGEEVQTQSVDLIKTIEKAERALNDEKNLLDVREKAGL